MLVLLILHVLVTTCLADSTCPLKEALNCSEDEPTLEKAFAYWGNETLHPNVFLEFCARLPANQINAGRIAPLYVFHVKLLGRKVYMSCCDPDVSCKNILETDLSTHRDLRESILDVLERVYKFLVQ